jgi:hypothetical protein
MDKKDKIESCAILNFNSVKVKLFLYVGVAVTSSLIADLSHYTCKDKSWSDITEVHWVVIFLNFILQGLIAWRAFIDGSVYQRQEELNKEQIHEHKLEMLKKHKPRIKP